MPCQFCTKRGHSKYNCPAVFPELLPLYKRIAFVHTQLYRGDIDATNAGTLLRGLAKQIIAMALWLRYSKNKDV